MFLVNDIYRRTETTLRTGVSTFEVKLQPLGGASIIIAPISRNVSDETDPPTLANPSAHGKNFMLRMCDIQ